MHILSKNQHPLSIRIILRLWNELPLSLQICLVTTTGSSLLHLLLRLSQNFRNKWHNKYKLVRTIMELLPRPSISSMVLLKIWDATQAALMTVKCLFQNMLRLYRVGVSVSMATHPSVSTRWRMRFLLTDIKIQLNFCSKWPTL